MTDLGESGEPVGKPVKRQVDFMVAQRVQLYDDDTAGTIKQMWDCRCVFVKWDDPERWKNIVKVEDLRHTDSPMELKYHPRPQSRKLYRTLP